jgi:hypothetical protein
MGAFMELPRQHAAATTSGDWTMYLYNYGRSDFNSAETIINPSSAPHLKVHWSYKAGKSITTQPVVVNGRLLATVAWAVCWRSIQRTEPPPGKIALMMDLCSLLSQQCQGWR